jgi:hypothetical protein
MEEIVRSLAECLVQQRLPHIHQKAKLQEMKDNEGYCSY